MRRHTSRASDGAADGTARSAAIWSHFMPVERAPDLVERVPGFLQRLYPE